MSDEQAVPAANPGWKWYSTAILPLGWDAAFLGPDDLLTHPEKYEKVIPIRALSKLAVMNEKEPGKRVLQMFRCLAGQFGCQDFASLGMIDRKMVSFVFEATPGAADDWTKTWTEVQVPESELLIATEAEADQLGQIAKQKAEIAAGLKAGRFKSVR